MYLSSLLLKNRYWFILLTAIAEFCAYAMGIALAVHISIASKYTILKYNYLLMAIILSSFGKGLLILMMIWDYPAYPFALSTLLNAFVLTSNVVALKGKKLFFSLPHPLFPPLPPTPSTSYTSPSPSLIIPYLYQVLYL